MLVKLIDGTKICSAFSFDCIPVGYNLGFEHKFLMAKSRLYGLPEINVLSHPCIDLHSIGIMMNRGEFKGSGSGQDYRQKTERWKYSSMVWKQTL